MVNLICIYLFTNALHMCALCNIIWIKGYNYQVGSCTPVVIFDVAVGYTPAKETSKEPPVITGFALLIRSQ